MIIRNESLLDCFRQASRCEWCGQGLCGHYAHPHHVFTRGSGRLDIRINLIALCPPFVTRNVNGCHADVHAGVMLRCDLLAVVAVREGLMQDRIEAIVWELRRWPKDADLPARLKRWVDAPASNEEMRVLP